MTAATVSKSFVALPWYGATILVIEFSTNQGSPATTLDLTTLDGGQGLKFVDGILEFLTTGGVQTSVSSCTSANGTTLGIGLNATSGQIVVIGR